jgi:type III restriction enzyme
LTNSPERPKKIDIALTRGSEARLLAVLDPYNPKGSARFVNFH